MWAPPLVSIIIPTYNRATLLKSALDSVRAQTYTHWEAIVVDDGSTDNTRELVAQYPEVRYVYQANQRQAAARNTGLRHAQGQYIASLDSDDTWHPEFLAKSVAILEEQQLDFVFANHQHDVRDGSHLSWLAGQPYWQRYLTQPVGEWWLLTPAQARRMFLDTCPAPSSALVIRRTSLAGNWNEQMLIADDWCLVLDMLLSAPRQVAFTLVPSWHKYTQQDNVYDGQEQLLVLERLGLHDNELMRQRFDSQLTWYERVLIRRRLASFHLQYAYIIWKLNGVSKEMLQKAAKAFALAPWATSRQSLHEVRTFLQRKWLTKP